MSTQPVYHFLVETDGPKTGKRRYEGTDPADAMAAWSAAITAGYPYVMIEALRERTSERVQRGDRT